MKKLLTILLLFISFLTFGQDTYYVSPAGDDAAVGDITHPWKTWQKAFNSTDVGAGDTVYFRGGTYMKDLSVGSSSWYYPDRDSQNGTGINISRDGTAGNFIQYWNYPGEVPILDCYDAYSTVSVNNYGIRANGVNYVHFRGLVVQNVRQIEIGGTLITSGYAMGVKLDGNYFILENCTFRHNWGVGIELQGATAPNYNWLINCDSYNNCDSLSTFEPGNDGTGFRHLEGGNVAYIHCRAWLNGDQGWSNYAITAGGASQYTLYDGCWAFMNGSLQGIGSGFKYGRINYTNGGVKRTFKNCFAGYNRLAGFNTLDASGTYAAYTEHFNNVSYHNGWHTGWTYELTSGYGFDINNVSADAAGEYNRIYTNNIAYNNERGAVRLGGGATYTHTYNTWDTPPGVTLTDADFISVDSTGLSGARGANGALPDLSGFLHITAGSDLIGAGIGVGLIYDGDSLLWDQDAPSLGAYEYDAPAPPPPPDYPAVSTSSVSPRSIVAYSGGTDLNDGMGTISAKGVCWSTGINPNISDSKTVDGTGTDDFTSTITGLAANTTYHIRSYVTNETGTTYGTDISFTTPKYTILKATKPLKIGTKILVIP